MFRALTLCAFILVSWASSAYANAAPQKRMFITPLGWHESDSHHSSLLGRRDDSLNSKLVVSQATLTAKIGDCKKINATFLELFADPFENSGFVIERDMLCIGGGSEALFSFHLVAEALNPQDFALLASLAKEIETREAFGISLKFLNVIQVSQFNSLEVKAPQSQKPIWKSEHLNQIPTYAGFNAIIGKENRAFRNPSSKVFQDACQSLLSGSEMESFMKSISKEVEVTSWHRARFKREDGEYLEANLATGNWRQCFDSSTPCLE